MNEELDYMSDDFIKNCENSDIRPGLLKTHRELRQHNLNKKKTSVSENVKKPIEVLEESLKQPLDATNKGFSMLEKMGFKSGMGLGKNNSGIKEPIGLNIKNDKVGLGQKTANKTIQKMKRESKLDKINENDFRAFQSQKNRDRETLSDFRKSQRICKALDLESEKSSPQEPWFWPEEELVEQNTESTENVLQKNDSDDGDNVLELNNTERLEMLTKYLRQNYFYCIWCKVQYNDEKDLQDCPGLTRDDH